MKSDRYALKYLFRIAINSMCFISSLLYADHSEKPFNLRRNGSSQVKLCNAPPIQVNQNTDILLDYAQVALSDLYFPLLPDLSSVIGNYNTWYTPLIKVNPANKENIVVLYRQNSFRQALIPNDQRTFTTLTNSGPQIGFSNNGGKNWSHTIAALPTWLSANGLAQTITGFHINFHSNGALFLLGMFNSTSSLNPFDPSGGVWVAKSIDGGASWSLPTTLETELSTAYAHAVGLGNSHHGSILCDLTKDNIVHTSYSKIDYSRNTLYGNIWYTRSLDQGENWELPRLIYDMILDPKWVREHGYTNETADILLGGQALGGTLVEVPDPCSKKVVLLNAFMRFYPKPGAQTYTQEPSDTLTDHAIIRSFDHGATWTQEAIEVGQYVFARSHDPTQPFVSSLLANDASIRSLLAVSPKTGRVYYVWQGGNPAVSPDPTVSQAFPMIQLSASNDAGKNWSSAVTVSQTPLNPLIIGANQSFNPNIAVTKNGLVGIIYTDFRNYDGSPTVVATDHWLAIYRETKNPKGGSTGVGLDFVKEIRLSPQSFNALIGFNSNVLGIGTSNGIDVIGKDFVTAFNITNQENLALIPGGGPFGSTQDLNNRINVFFKKICFGKKK